MEFVHWLNGVVPDAAVFMRADQQCGQLLTPDRVPTGLLRVASSAVTCSPARVRVAAMLFTTTSWLVRGLPRQFIVVRSVMPEACAVRILDAFQPQAVPAVRAHDGVKLLVAAGS